MKTELIKIETQIVKTGTACIGCMHWESPYIIFKDSDSDNTYKWHSDNLPGIFKALAGCDWDSRYTKEGTWYKIKARVRNNKVWRMIELEYM